MLKTIALTLLNRALPILIGELWAFLKDTVATYESVELTGDQKRNAVTLDIFRRSEHQRIPGQSGHRSRPANRASESAVSVDVDIPTFHQSLLRNAEDNERIAAHLEDSKRVWQRVEKLEDSINELEKSLIELRAHNRQLLEFSAGVKKAGWIVVTCGGVVLWWIIQRWVEQHGR